MRRILSVRPLVLPILGLLVTVFLLGSCATLPPRSPAPVLLISMDGFRWDYLALHPNETPHLRQLAQAGVQAQGLLPVFPSNTFPNHYAIVTGLYPSHSGIVNNHMFDASRGEFFHYNQPHSSHDGSWWGGEPIWITAVKQGRTSACSFWPGSEAEIKGVHATWWKAYDYSIPFERRLDELVGWLKLPPDKRPVVTTFYLEETNAAGHTYGPDSPELATTVKQMDDRIGAIMNRFAAEGITVNFVVVSDHGMTNCSPDRVVILDDYIDLNQVRVDFDETVAGLRPAPGASENELVAQLQKMPHAKVYRAKDLPAHLHVDPSSPRVPSIWVLPDEGWHALRRASFERAKNRFLKGQHGYDPLYPTMHGLFIASGPAFRRGVKIPEFENIQIYNLLCATAGLKPGPNDGDDRLVKAALK